MWHQKRTTVVLVAVLVAAAASTEQADAAVTASGSFRPDPFPADGVVNSKMQLGVSADSTGTVTVTDGDTLTTKQSSRLGDYVTGTGRVNVTNSTWTAESAVFMAPQFRTEGTVNLNNSTWTVESNVAIAQGDESTGTVTLEGGSSWTVESGVNIASGEDCTATVNVNSGTWTAESGVTLGGSDFVAIPGTGTISIKTGGVMDSQYALNVMTYGNVELDGGMLSLAGQTDFDGSVSALSNGGTIRLNTGPSIAGHCLVNVGSGVDFTNCDIDIVFRSGFTPNPSATFDLFDPTGDVDLPAALGMADMITTPADWQLDLTTGVLSFVPEPATLTLLLLGVCTLPRRRG